MNIITRSEAKAAGLKHYFTGKPCKHGHIHKRMTSSGNCMECDRTNETRKEKRREYSRKERAENMEKVRERNRRSEAKHRESRIERKRKYREKNGEKIRAYYKENKIRIDTNNKQWASKNREKTAAIGAKRRAVELQRTPLWLTSSDNKAFKAKFAEAAWMTSRTGIKHHVDHFYPLQGKTVSGLHVPANLRVIPSRENHKKLNKVPTVNRLPL